MNRTILVLNVVVLVVNFVLALTTTDSQIGLLRSASGMADRASWRGRGVERADSLAYLRIIQSVGGFVPAERPLTHSQLQAIHDALDRYRQVIDNGVARVLYDDASASAKQTKRSFERVGKTAREEIEYLLGAAFQDTALAARITTEIIRHAA